MPIDLKNLPPMSTLIALEAVVRHLSFTQAAQELRVSPAAVSQQVKALEDILGFQLIHRVRPQILATSEAEKIANAVRQGIGTIENTVRPMLQQTNEHSLRVATVTAFSSFWLMPRLPRFFAAHPGIEVSLLTREREIRPSETHFDIGIRYGQDKLPDVETCELFRDELVPVCSPRYLGSRIAPQTAKDLQREALLHLVSDEPWIGWLQWFEAQNVDFVGAATGAQFSNTVLLVQAAVDGLGIALGWRRLVEPLLQDGRLMRVTDLAIRSDAPYSIAVPKARTRSAAVRAFRTWLLEEAASDW